MGASEQIGRKSRPPILAVSCGFLLLLVGLGVAVFPGDRSPGKLIAVQDELVWKGEAGKEPSDMYAVGEFTVMNTGGTPVRIVEATSSCGCAKPTLSTMVVQPDAKATVRVQALVQAVGEKKATIKLQTDSIQTPEVLLKLQIISTRRPPFMVHAGGDLSFKGDYSLTENRNIVVTTVAPRGGMREPIIRHVMPFLSVSPPTIKTLRLKEEGMEQIDYLYEVRVSSKPPEGLTLGEVLVTDPWYPERVERLPVALESPPALRVMPSRLVVRNDGGIEDSAVTFIVRSRLPMNKLSFADRGKGKSPFNVEVVKQSDDGLTTVCKLQCAALAIESPEDREIAIRPAGGSEGLTIPVRIMPRRKPR